MKSICVGSHVNLALIKKKIGINHAIYYVRKTVDYFVAKDPTVCLFHEVNE